jgi:hypothetical protein
MGFHDRIQGEIGKYISESGCRVGIMSLFKYGGEHDSMPVYLLGL